MIYTITFNPCLDYTVHVEDLKLGLVNRTVKEEVFLGGKGVNVSMVLKNLGMENTAMGFIAGFTGDEICRKLQENKITSDFIRVAGGMSRINVKLKAQKETEINGIGPAIGMGNVEQLMEKLERLKSGDSLVLAGSIPGSLPEDMYERILKRLFGRGVRVVVDATKNLLLSVCRYRPFLIKPNHHELGEMFGVELQTKDEIIDHAKKLQALGAQNVLISMAAKGAILLGEDGNIYESLPPDGKVVNSTGAGDSMVAGFLTGYLKTNGDLRYAFHLGLAAGSASAFSETLATGDEIMALMDKDNEWRN